ncbi:MAG: sigma-70 family RNA polymerase sigma factor [Clostridium sp.]|nr:sigma-70 family RNA polymerase sigma factor [Clostridium sp.]
MLSKETFAKLVIDSTDSLYRVSKSILKNDSDCEDAVSEAITIAFQKLDSLKQEEYAKTWLTRILIHECFRIRRQRSKVMLAFHQAEPELEHFMYSGNQQDAYVDDYFDLYQAMRNLNENQRLTVTLYYIEGYSVKEIAQMTGVSQGTVKSRLSRGRSQLKQFLEEGKCHA